ncbi:hypothetical protein, partial [Pseudomonas aeruginosa]
SQPLRSSGGEKRISSGFVVRMIILIFPHYTIRRDNGKVFLLTFRTQKIKANNHGENKNIL